MDALQGMRQLSSRIGNMIVRGVLRSVNAAGRMQVLQLGLLAGETKDRLEHMEPYGFTSHPKRGAEAVAVFLDGDRSHGVVLVVADRRYRLQGLAAGEMAIHDDLGQKVHLTRDGIVIDGAGLPINITNTPSITMTTPTLTTTGDMVIGGNLQLDGNYNSNGTMTNAGKNVGGTHTHGGVDPGAGNSLGPNP